MLILRRLIMSCIILIAIWAYGLTAFIGGIPREVTNPDKETDGIIILTGGINRLDTAIKLLNNNKAQKLLVSGVGKDANLASLLILSGNLPDDISNLLGRIDLGYEAASTKGNAEEAAKWVKENNYKSIRLVTSNYHLKRSVIEFEKVMPDVELVEHPVISSSLELDKWWQHGGTKKLLVSEYNKYLVAKICSLLWI